MSNNEEDQRHRHAQMHGDLIIAVSIITMVLVVVIIIFLIIKCRRDHQSKKAAIVTKYSCENLSTHHTHFGTAQRRAANTAAKVAAKSNGGHAFDSELRRMSTDYENGVLPIPPTDEALMTSPPGRSPFAHIHMNGGGGGGASGTMSRQTLLIPSSSNHNGINGGGIPGGGSDSDSWIESSRSRETSPASSIPPGMAPFRVIPLCDSESSGTHLSDPCQTAFTTLGANTPAFPRTSGSDMGDRPYGPMYPRSGSENGSSAPSDHWPDSKGLPNGAGSTNGLTNGGGAGSSSSNGNSSSGAQPLLRRNQYWV